MQLFPNREKFLKIDLARFINKVLENIKEGDNKFQVFKTTWKTQEF